MTAINVYATILMNVEKGQATAINLSLVKTPLAASFAQEELAHPASELKKRVEIALISMNAHRRLTIASRMKHVLMRLEHLLVKNYLQ